jgi:hypothetical protein
VSVRGQGSLEMRSSLCDFGDQRSLLNVALLLSKTGVGAECVVCRSLGGGENEHGVVLVDQSLDSISEFLNLLAKDAWMVSKMCKYQAIFGDSECRTSLGGDSRLLDIGQLLNAGLASEVGEQLLCRVEIGTFPDLDRLGVGGSDESERKARVGGRQDQGDRGIGGRKERRLSREAINLFQSGFRLSLEGVMLIETQSRGDDQTGGVGLEAHTGRVDVVVGLVVVDVEHAIGGLCSSRCCRQQETRSQSHVCWL